MKRKNLFKLSLKCLCLVLALGVFDAQAKLNIDDQDDPGGSELNLSFFHAQGRDLVSDSTNERFVFRGVNLNGLEFGSFFDNPYPPNDKEGTNYFKPRPEDFDNIKTEGFNVIRVPFEWARLVPGWKPTDPLPTSLNATYLGYLNEVVQMAGDEGIYVILDMHDFLKYWSGQSSQACVDDNPSYQELLSETWKLTALNFRNNPAVLGYDIMNEPVRQEQGEPCGSCHWVTIAQLIIDKIRTVDTNHLIFVEGPNYSLASDWQIENGKTAFVVDRITPPRIVYSPHVFFDFGNDSRYTDSGEETGPVGIFEHYVRDRLMPILDWSLDNNVPIFLGETNVPCTAEWADVLDYIFRNFLQPFHISAALWHYIDPAHCSLTQCPLNLLACGGNLQLDVLAQFPPGPYSQEESFQPTPLDSLLYADERINPWESGSGYWGNVAVNFCAGNPVYRGNCSLEVSFYQSNYDGVKFYHHYGIDTRHFKTLRFWIYLTGGAQQDFKIFTTAPLSDCNFSPDPEYPPYSERPALAEFIPSRTAGKWQKVEIPLDRMVDPQNPIINGVAFQNIGKVQDILILDEIYLVGFHGKEEKRKIDIK